MVCTPYNARHITSQIQNVTCFEANTVNHEDDNKVGTVLFPFPSSTMALESSKVPLP